MMLLPTKSGGPMVRLISFVSNVLLACSNVPLSNVLLACFKCTVVWFVQQLDRNSYLQQHRQRYQAQRDQAPLFDQPVVHSKMLSFYSKLTSLEFHQGEMRIDHFHHIILWLVQGLTQVEEMLVSAFMPVMSIYRLPLGQYGYTGHVINLPQDVISFACSLLRVPSELDVLVFRKDKDQSHHDFRVWRTVVQEALMCLLRVLQS